MPTPPQQQQQHVTSAVRNGRSHTIAVAANVIIEKRKSVLLEA
jgi:hypothetical protein